MNGSSKFASDSDHHLVNHKMLVMGVSKYIHLDRVDGATSDARAVESMLSERGRFRSPNVVRPIDHRLLDLRARVRSFLEALDSRDAAIVFFAGHGMLDDQQRLWLMPTDAEQPMHGILVDDMVNWSHAAGLVIFILDCCHAEAALRPSISPRENGSEAFIAACHRLSQARSEGGHGVLTRAFIDTIEAGATRLSDVIAGTADRCETAEQAAVTSLTRRHAAFHIVSPRHQSVNEWRAYVREMHSNLIPFFDERTVLETRDVIEIDVSPDEGEGLGIEPGGGGVGTRPSMHIKELLGRPSKSSTAPRWVILGEPGAGKSTLARHLAWSLCVEDAPTNAPVPIFFSLTRLINSRQHPFVFAQAELDQVAGRNTGLAAALKDLAERTLEAQGASNGAPIGGAVAPIWLLLDGFDEVPREHVAQAIDALKGWHRRLPAVTIAVCSRPVGWAKGIDHIFRRAAVRPLEVDQQCRLLTKWLGKELALAVHRRTTRSLPLSELAQNPLMLTLLAMMHLEHRTLPATRTALYGHALDLLLRRGHCVQPSKGVRSVQEARAVLAEVSLQLTWSGAEAWHDAQLSRILGKIRAESHELNRVLEQVWGSNPDTFFADVAQHSGIIAPHDGSQERWRYLHRSLRERLAAEALVVRGPKAVVDYIRTVARDENELGQWAETLGLTCSLLEAPTAAFRELVAANEDLAWRMLPEIDAIPSEDAISLAGGLASLDLERLVRALRGRHGAVDAVLEGVDPSADLDYLGRLFYVLERVDPSFDQERFFRACGKRQGGESRPELPDMCRVPGGFFGMDHDSGREVTLSRDFDLGKYPVTVADYLRFDPRHECLGGSAHPVTKVSWWKARLYAAWLGCMLPTEAQWERACRAGTTTRFWSGDTTAELAQAGWFMGNSGGNLYSVGEHPANPYGLHDMHGNVWEWCTDWYAKYGVGSVSDPTGPSAGTRRVLRGGSAWVNPGHCRSASRHCMEPGYQDVDVGFRVARLVSDA